jgi:hypothetical protein
MRWMNMLMQCHGKILSSILCKQNTQIEQLLRQCNYSQDVSNITGFQNLEQIGLIVYMYLHKFIAH